MAYERKQRVGILSEFENQKTQLHLLFAGILEPFQIGLEILKSFLPFACFFLVKGCINHAIQFVFIQLGKSAVYPLSFRIEKGPPIGQFLILHGVDLFQACNHPLILLLCHRERTNHTFKLFSQLFFSNVFVRAFLLVMGTPIVDIFPLLFAIANYATSAMPASDQVCKSNLSLFIIRFVTRFKLSLNLIESLHSNNGRMMPNTVHATKHKMPRVELVFQNMMNVTAGRLGRGGTEAKTFLMQLVDQPLY